MFDIFVLYLQRRRIRTDENNTERDERSQREASEKGNARRQGETEPYAAQRSIVHNEVQSWGTAENRGTGEELGDIQGG